MTGIGYRMVSVGMSFRGALASFYFAARDRPVVACGLLDLDCACCFRPIDRRCPLVSVRLTLFEHVAFPTLRWRISLAAVELLAD